MIYTTLEENGTKTGFLFNSYDNFFNATFNPEINVTCYIDFKIHGKTYAERKACAAEIAKEFQAEQAPGLSWGEALKIQFYFDNLAHRFGLVKEFQENCII